MTSRGTDEFQQLTLTRETMLILCNVLGRRINIAHDKQAGLVDWATMAEVDFDVLAPSITYEEVTHAINEIAGPNMPTGITLFWLAYAYVEIAGGVWWPYEYDCPFTYAPMGEAVEAEIASHPA